jgi:hypothetical protein
MAVTPITLRLGEHEVAGELNDSQTALELLDLLPLDLPLKDFHQQEKLARLPRPLTVRGAPATSDAGPADIGYYAPGQTFVLYYETIGVFPGVIRIGHFADDAVELLRQVADGTVVSVSRT